MLLQTLGSLILVVGASYLLHSASWQVVLLSFVLAGVGYAIWIVRKAIIRRAKIKALWKRSLQLDAMLEHVDEPSFSAYPHVQRSERQSVGKTCLALEGPVRANADKKEASDDNQAKTLEIPPIIEYRRKRHTSDYATPPLESRVYKFSMKALAEAREPQVKQQATV